MTTLNFDKVSTQVRPLAPDFVYANALIIVWLEPYCNLECYSKVVLNRKCFCLLVYV